MGQVSYIWPTTSGGILESHWTIYMFVPKTGQPASVLWQPAQRTGSHGHKPNRLTAEIVGDQKT